MSESGEFIIKARGLPWSATTKDVLDFFKDCDIVGEADGVHLTRDNQGRASGECFVELASQSDVEKAKAHNKENMGKRYIEIHDSRRAEMQWFVNRMPGPGGQKLGGGGGSDGFVRLRGLPFEAAKSDIASFFAGIEIAPYGITITMDQNGRPSGDAYVEFVSPEEAEKALGKNKQKIGHRWVEIFKSSKYDVQYVVPSGNAMGGGFPQMMGGRPGPYDRPGFPGQGGMNNFGPSGFSSGGNFGGRRGGGPMRGGQYMGGIGVQNSTTGHLVHMRGLPFEATQGDVFQFFAPLKPAEVRLLTEESGRAKGECDVDFHTHSDAEAAMAKNKQNMGHRYIELFLRSTPDINDSWSNNGSLFGSGNTMTNSGGQSNAGYGGGYGGFTGGMGGGAAGGMGGGGNYTSDGYGLSGASSGYSSFSEKTNYTNLPQSTTGNYYSSMR